MFLPVHTLAQNGRHPERGASTDFRGAYLRSFGFRALSSALTQTRKLLRPLGPRDALSCSMKPCSQPEKLFLVHHALDLPLPRGPEGRADVSPAQEGWVFHHVNERRRPTCLRNSSEAVISLHFCRNRSARNLYRMCQLGPCAIRAGAGLTHRSAVKRPGLFRKPCLLGRISRT